MAEREQPRTSLQRDGVASSSSSAPASSGAAPRGIVSPPALAKCCYGLLMYSRKHYDSGHEPSCVGVKINSESLNPPRVEQGEAWGNFRYSCLGYSVYRAGRGHKDGAVDLPACEFGVEVLATATGKEEKGDKAKASARMSQLEQPDREVEPLAPRRPPSPQKKPVTVTPPPISVGLDDFPQKWAKISKKMLEKMGQNLEYSRKAVVNILIGKWGDDKGPPRRP